MSKDFLVIFQMCSRWESFKASWAKMMKCVSGDCDKTHRESHLATLCRPAPQSLTLYGASGHLITNSSSSSSPLLYSCTFLFYCSEKCHFHTQSVAARSKTVCSPARLQMGEKTELAPSWLVELKSLIFPSGFWKGGQKNRLKSRVDKHNSKWMLIWHHMLNVVQGNSWISLPNQTYKVTGYFHSMFFVAPRICYCGVEWDCCQRNHMKTPKTKTDPTYKTPQPQSISTVSTSARLLSCHTT